MKRCFKMRINLTKEEIDLLKREIPIKEKWGFKTVAWKEQASLMSKITGEEIYERCNDIGHMGLYPNWWCELPKGHKGKHTAENYGNDGSFHQWSDNE